MTAEFIRKLQEAAGRYQRGDFDGALEGSLHALTLAPDHPEGLHMKALALGKLGRIDEALSAFDAAASRHPQKQAILANKGNALLAAGRREEAVAAYQASIEADPDFVPAWAGLGNAYRRTEDFPQAEKAFRRALELAPHNPDIMNNLGAALASQDRFSEAEEQFSKALELQPAMVSALVNRGAALRKRGENEAALEDHRKAVALAPQHPEALYQLANTLRQSSALEEAERYYRAALQGAPERVDINRDFARMLWEIGDSQHFLSPLDQSINATKSADLMTLKSELAYIAGQTRIAEEAAIRAIRSDPELSTPHRIIGMLRRHERDYKSAIASLERAANIDPTDFESIHVLAETLMAAGEYDRAVKMLEGEAPPEHLQKHIALKATAMRLTGSADYRRYYDYDRFTRKMMIETPEGFDSLSSFNAALAEVILKLHTTKTQPLEQTLYGGTQSFGRLWDNPDPVIRALKDALLGAATKYVEALPDDSEHPFLSRKSTNLECAGAWSVVLASGGGHVDHIHPKGWISASYYVRVPEEVLAGEKPGFLRLGASGVPGVELEAERWFKPEEGAVVFFPSYIWHGVEMFSARSQRITAPFDLFPVLSTH